MEQPLVEPHTSHPASRRRSERPIVRTTFQLGCDLVPRDDRSLGWAVAEAQKLSLSWACGPKRYPGDLPQQSWDGSSFVAEVPGYRLECTSIPQRGVWSLRLTQPDGRQPGRTWTTEIALRSDNNNVRVGVRGQCASPPMCVQPILLTRPRIVLELAKTFSLREVINIEDKPWRPKSEADLQRLLSLLENPDRTMPVFVLTEPDPKQLGIDASEFLLDADDLARKTHGLAHVVTMNRVLGYSWTAMVGKPWSTFLGAVRTYQPGLDFDEDDPYDHPLAMAERILFWKHNDHIAERAFVEFLREQAHRNAATKRVDWRGCLFLNDARSLEAEIAQQSATAPVQKLQQAEKKIESLEEKIRELEQEAEAFNDDSIAASRDRDRYIEENKILRARINAIQARLEEKTESPLDSEVVIPDGYDRAKEWVDEHLAGRLQLHPRALQGLKKAVFRDVGLVYQCLLLLANEYRDQQRSIEGARQKFEQRTQELGLRISRSVTKSRAGEQGDTYYVKWPLHSDRLEFLEWHLRKGTNFDPQLCLGVYFFWDGETEQVIVGWLPSHLSTRISN